MNNKFYIESSGIPLVDKTWGGFYIGGSYFLIGPRGSGKTIFGIQYARECVRKKQVCLFFTSMKLKELLTLAAAIDFDMEAFINQGLIIIIKMTLPKLSRDFARHDGQLSVNWNQIISVVEEYKADKILFDDFTPFLSFNNFSTLQEVFHSSTEVLEENRMTGLFILSEPANRIAEHIVKIAIKESNGVIYINKDEKLEDCNMTIIPVLGHPEGQFKSRYSINACEGITVEYNDLSPIQEISRGEIKMEQNDGYGLGNDGRRNVFDNELTFGKDDDFSSRNTDEETEM